LDCTILNSKTFAATTSVALIGVAELKTFI
jgi:hypothetical protein